ncbi:MAG: LAGLIDADG family homing endonuclease [bacterium]|nr:LAGLIDADG family homing endonuclease [bacterium]
MISAHRVQFLTNPRKYFAAVRKAYAVPWSHIAQNIRVSNRTVTSWRSHENTMPLDIAEKWRVEFGIILPRHAVIDLDKKRKEAGSLGGKAREIMYGNLGTPEGRRRGGLRSQQTHKNNPLSPFVARPVATPRRDVHFAELIGAILGDGTVTEYQMILYSNASDEVEYSQFLTDLVTKVFHVPTATHRVRNYGVIRVACSRTEVIAHLQKAGVGIGNKVRRQAGVPLWIKRNNAFAQACVRGLVDTDGCVYLDRHRVKDKEYASICIAFTNASIPLLDFVFETWKSLGFHPTRHRRDVRLRRREEVIKYAKQVGFSNSKHARKIQV